MEQMKICLTQGSVFILHFVAFKKIFCTKEEEINALEID